MKKILSILLVIALILMFSACGTEEVSSSETNVGLSSEVVDSSSQNLKPNIGESSKVNTEQNSTIGLSSSDTPHTHTFKKATCTAPSTCECGKTKGEPLGHDFNKATCTEAGKCSICGEEKGEPLGHTFKNATCTEPKTCVICDAKEGEPLSHNYKESRFEGNCLQKGYIDRICTRCRESSIEYLGTSEHTYVEYYEQDSNMQHKKIYTCQICSHSYSEYYEHNYGDWITVKEATASEQGQRSCECSTCGYVKTETIPKTQPSENTTPTTPSVSQGDYLNQVLELVNAERQKAGLSPLQYYSAGQSFADIRASEIVTKFSHTRPDETQWHTVLDGLDYRMCGENIAYGYKTPETVMNGWMNSEGHKANILEASFTHIIVGYDASSKAWVQLFLGLR